MHKHTFKNLKESYNFIYNFKKYICLKEGKTEDKSSREANIYAVKNNWKIYMKNKGYL